MKKAEKASTFVVVLALFLSLSMVNLHVIEVRAQELPTVQMNPSSYSVQNASLPFSLNLTITNVTDLYGWQARIYFENTVLNFVSATEGPFLDSVGSTYFALSPYTTNEFNATYGMVALGDVLIGNVSGVDGSGTLATLTFQPVGGGNTTLHFDLDPNSGTFLIDSNLQPITFTAVDASANVPQSNDLAVTNVVPWKTVISQGYSGNFTVTVSNTGPNSETFNVTLSGNSTGNSTSIKIQTVTLASDSSTNMTFTWNTTGFAYGNYTVSAYAWPLPGEANVANNNFTYGVVKVSIVGDINGDFKVNLSDLTLLAKAYNTKPGNPKWNPNADFKNEGMVGLDDLTLMARHYNTGLP